MLLSIQVFEGSWDRDTPVTHLFFEAITVLHIRIHPVQWYMNIAMRFELLGCVGKFCLSTSRADNYREIYRSHIWTHVLPLNRGVTGIFSEGAKSFFLIFFPGVKCFFPVKNSHFGRPKTNFRRFQKWKAKKKKKKKKSSPLFITFLLLAYHIPAKFQHSSNIWFVLVHFLHSSLISINKTLDSYTFARPETWFVH